MRSRFVSAIKIGLLSLTASTVLTGCNTAASSEDQLAEVSNKVSLNPTEKNVRMGAGGFVTGVVVHPQAPHTVYVRTDNGGLFRLDRASDTWQQLIIYDRIGVKTSRSIESVAISPSDPNILYTAVGFFTHKDGEKIYGYLLKSTDGGDSWRVLDLSLPMTGNGQWRWAGERLAVDPHNSDIVYYGTSLDGLWRSADGGDSWKQLAADTIPFGESFEQTENLPGVTFVEFDADSVVNGKTQTIYAGVAGKGIYRTIDGGDSWEQLADPNFSELVPQQGEVASNGELVVTFYDSQPERKGGGVWKYNGAWQEITPQANYNYSPLTVDSSNPNHLLVASNPITPDTLFRSTDGGTTWQKLNNRHKRPSWWPDWVFWNLVGDVAINPGNPSEAWVTTGLGVWHTTELDKNSVTWITQLQGIEQTVAFDGVSTPGGADLVTAIADWDGFRHTDINLKPEYSHNRGEFTTTTSIAYSANDPNFLVRVGGHQFRHEEKTAGYSTDNGQTWNSFESLANNSHPAELKFGNIAVSATDTQNIVWQPTESAPPYWSKDGGKTWQKSTLYNKDFGAGVHTDLWNRQQALAADSVTDGTFYLYNYATGELLRSEDGGTNWIVTNQNSLLPTGVSKDATVRTMLGKAGEIWVSLGEQGLYFSSDRGKTFTKVAAVEIAKVFDFGASASNSNNPTVLVQGKVNDQLGVFASTDLGQTWTRYTDLPTQFLSGTITLVGDKNNFGRVYIGTTGNGFLYGDLQPQETKQN